MEYVFAYVDDQTGGLKSITAFVEAVYDDCIKVKYLTNTVDSVCGKCPKKRVNTNSSIMPRCSCILNPPDVSKYNGPEILFIPIANLLNVSYVTTEKYNGEVRVMLLGISAEVVKAIIIRMAIFDDKYEDSIKQVSLEAGNVYDITYVSGNHTFTNRAKVVSIEEVGGCICSRPGTGYVREHIGCYNSVYANFSATKEEFMTANPAKKVKIVVDTSTDFSGVCETIMLDTIRDCTLVSADSGNEEGNVTEDSTNENPACTCCQYNSGTCHPSTCGHCNNSSIFEDAYLEDDTLVVP